MTGVTSGRCRGPVRGSVPRAEHPTGRGAHHEPAGRRRRARQAVVGRAARVVDPGPPRLHRAGRGPAGDPGRLPLDRHADPDVHRAEGREGRRAAAEPAGGAHDRHRGLPAEGAARARVGDDRARGRRAGRVRRRVVQADRRRGAAGRVGAGRACALRADGPDHDHPGLGEAAGLRDDDPEGRRGPGRRAGLSAAACAGSPTRPRRRARPGSGSPPGRRSGGRPGP